MLTQEFHYDLPAELIAQHPVQERDAARLLVVHRTTGALEHRRFTEVINFLRPGDVLIVNDSRVIPARLRGLKADSGGEFEILLLEENDPLDWWVLLRPGKRVRPGSRLQFQTRSGSKSELSATVVAKNDEGWCRLRFSGVPALFPELPKLGEVPLPPYIHRLASAVGDEDRNRYQTVYAQNDGSIAAPTAGLHLTLDLLEQFRNFGLEIHPVTLHVGHGTFAPVKSSHVEDHVMHEERFEITTATAEAVNRAKATGRRVVAVGTTSVRVLESVARTHGGRLVAGAGRTRIFLHPPTTFEVVDILLTNFHLPESTLLMLVSAFAAPNQHPQGRDLVLQAYREAIRERYRFFSYGDTTLWI